MKRTLSIPVLVGGIIIAGLGWGLWPDRQAGTQDGLLPYRDVAIVADGARIYAGYCADCHGANLQGQANWRVQDVDGYLPAPPHDETGHTWHHPDSLLIKITTNGTEALIGGSYQSRMVGFKDVLSEAQIIAVLAYIKSTWSQQAIDTHNRINHDAAATKS